MNNINRSLGALGILAFLVIGVAPALSQSTVRPCITTGTTTCPPVSDSTPMPIGAAFIQTARAPDLTASSVSSRVALGAATQTARVCNTSTSVTAYVALGSSSVTVTTSNGIIIFPSSCISLAVGSNTHLAGITAASTASLITSLGTGVAAVGGGGSSTSGTAVAGGSDTQVQYNSAGALGGITGWTSSGTRLTGTGAVVYSGASSSSNWPFSWNGAVSGTCTFGSGLCPVNVIHASGFAVDTGSPANNAGNLRVYANLGGAGQIGGYLGLDTTFLLNSTTGNSASNAYYQAFNSSANASVADNGTPGTERGSLFGIGNYSVLRTGATNWVQNIAQENDLSIQTGASALYAGGVSVILLADNAIAASRENFGFMVGAQTGATATIDCAFCMGGYQGINPLHSSAAIMAFRPNGGSGGGPTIASGIDLTKFTFTAAAFGSTGYSVSGTGRLSLSATGAASLSPLLMDGAIFTGGSGTTNFPAVFMQPSGTTAATTWNTAGTFIGANYTTGFTGNFIDFKGAGAATSKFTVAYTGLTTIASDLTIGSGDTNAVLTFGTRGRFSSIVAGTIQMGAVNAAAPVAQILRAQSVATGTADTAGQNWTMVGSLSTGSGTSGDIIFQTGATGAASTTLNTATSALIIKGATQQIRIPQIASDAAQTDNTVCADTTNKGLFVGSGTLGICLGTSGTQFKTAFAPMPEGIDELMKINFLNYRYIDGAGDNGVRKQYGTTAQNVEEVLPDLVRKNGFGETINYDSGALLIITMRAVQQLKTEIEALKAAK